MKLMNTFYLIVIAFFYFSTTQAQNTELEIWEIQGKSAASPYEGIRVESKANIVTLVRSDRFFMQCPSARSDRDSLTSDGIMVYVGESFSLQVGDIVTVTGIVQEYFGLTEFGPDNLNFIVDSTTNELLDPIVLDSNSIPTEASTLSSLEKYEGMLVSFTEARASGPSEQDIGPISLHSFRPFREAGIRFPGLSNLPVWDGNPEVITLNMQGIPSRPISTHMLISGSGALSFSNGFYQILAKEVDIEGEAVLDPVRVREDNEVTIGSLNCFVYDNRAANFSNRTLKLANYIIEVLHSPDILAVQEVRDLATLEALAIKINQLDPSVNYTAHLIHNGQGGSFQINNGYLVRRTIVNVQVSQKGVNEKMSTGELLHDRPPLLLEANFRTNPPTPIKVLNLHLRSLSGIEGSNQLFVRTKRSEAAVSVSRMIQDLQGNNLVVIGDFNAFPFSDGYVDVLAQLTGEPSLGAEYSLMPIVNPPLVNQSLSVPHEAQYSFVFNGNAQILDHCLTMSLGGISNIELQYARGNSDNPNSYLDNNFVPWRASDHDGLVMFLGLNDSLVLSSIETDLLTFDFDFPNPFSQYSSIKIDRKYSHYLEMKLLDYTGKLVYYQSISEGGDEIYIQPEWKLKPGLFFLSISSEKEIITKKIFLN